MEMKIHYGQVVVLAAEERLVQRGLVVEQEARKRRPARVVDDLLGLREDSNYITHLIVLFFDEQALERLEATASPSVEMDVREWEDLKHFLLPDDPEAAASLLDSDKPSSRAVSALARQRKLFLGAAREATHGRL